MFLHLESTWKKKKKKKKKNAANFSLSICVFYRPDKNDHTGHKIKKFYKTSFVSSYSLKLSTK